MALTVKTAAQLAAEKATAAKERAAAEARRTLAETDWMVTRSLETGRPIPDNIKAAREAARVAASMD